MRDRLIRVLQMISIALMWLFAIGVLVFVPWLVFVAARWNDALNWSLTISIIMIPVYLVVAGVLTYVYFGLQHGLPEVDDREAETSSGD
jgi:uncharacterized BrkB/YihY/UPF0761 family membrane protein